MPIVSLKVIQLGMDTREVIARLEAERQAPAMMNHPNIAEVLNAGTTGSFGSAESQILNLRYFGKDRFQPSARLTPQNAWSTRCLSLPSIVRSQSGPIQTYSSIASSIHLRDPVKALSRRADGIHE